MDDLFLRFQHIPEQIFEELNFESLMNARLVAPSWEQFIDDRAHKWSSFKDQMAELKKKCGYGGTPFHYACQNGQKDIAEIIMKNSAKFNIDLKAQNNDGFTAFHLVCICGHSSDHVKTTEMLMKNSAKFNA